MTSPSAERVRAIITKEWLDLRRNKQVISALLALPVILTTVSCGMLVVASRMAVTHPPKASSTPLPEHILRITSDPSDAGIVMIAFTALMMFSIVPVVLPSIMAAHSIVGEKLSRSLEPLLATPIRTWELLMGKLVAIVIPVLIPAFVAYATYVIVAWRAAPHVVFALLVSPPFLLTIGVVGPLAAVLAVTFGIMVSSRASDLQSAQGLSGLLVLPILAVGMGQLFGAVSVSVTGVLARALVLIVIDAGMLMLCVSVFERETILARWK